MHVPISTYVSLYLIISLSFARLIKKIRRKNNLPRQAFDMNPMNKIELLSCATSLYCETYPLIISTTVGYDNLIASDQVACGRGNAKGAGESGRSENKF